MPPAFQGVMWQAEVSNLLPTQEMPPSRAAGLSQELPELIIVRTRAGAQPHTASPPAQWPLGWPHRTDTDAHCPPPEGPFCVLVRRLRHGPVGCPVPRPLGDGLPGVHDGLALLLPPNLPKTRVLPSASLQRPPLLDTEHAETLVHLRPTAPRGLCTPLSAPCTRTRFLAGHGLGLPPSSLLRGHRPPRRFPG